MLRYFGILMVMLLMSGCASRHAAERSNIRWHELHAGMTKSEVKAILGSPNARVKPDPIPSDSAASALALRMAFDGWYERWEYGPVGWTEKYSPTSDEAFVVYFNTEGKVVKLRRPKAGPYTGEK